MRPRLSSQVSPLALAAVVGLVLAALAGCGDAPDDDEQIDGRDDDFMTGGKSDAFGVVEGSPEACAVLRLVNEATFEELRTVANPASINIDVYRSGYGTDTGPNPIETLAELDDVPFVGPVAFRKLLPYALGHYACEDAPPPAEDDRACAILRAADESDVEQLDVDAGLDRRAATAIVAAQPIATLDALDALPYVGAAALDALATYAVAEGLTCAAAGCAGTGGTFDGVTFSGDEECHAIEFANRARLSQMADLDATARRIVYHCAVADGGQVCTDGRQRAWTRLAELDIGLGGSRMAQLKAAAAAWTDDGQESDTIDSTWTNRLDLIGKPIGFDKVFVVKRTNPTAQSRFCYEVRDTPEAPTFLQACVWLTHSDAAPPCSFASCMDPLVGQYVAFRGVLGAESFPGGVGITVYDGARPTAPRE